MDYDTLQKFYEQLSTLAEQGDEAQAQELLGKRFSELPEDMQAELLTRLYFNALEEQGRDADAVAQLQEKGLAALDALEIMKKNLESKGA